MDGLELHVRKPRPQQYGQSVRLGVKETLKRRHTVGYGSLWRRHKNGITRPCPADPVLRAAKLTGILVASSPVRQQYAVNLADQAVGHREVFPQTTHAMLKRGHAVRDFDHVNERNPGRLV